MSIYETIQIIILVVSVFILIRQLSAIRKATALEGFNEIAAALNDSDNRANRNLLYEKKEKIDELDEDDQKKIKNQIVLLDTLGCLVNKNLIPERVAIEIYWDVIIRSWDACEKWIEKERQKKREIQNDLNIISTSNKKRYLKIVKIFTKLIKFSNKLIKRTIVSILYKKSPEFKFYPNKKPVSSNYGDTYYENFEMLVWRCEKYCWRRGLDRPSIY